ncbi:MAG: response regulator [Alphaproteobacteria bacterium]|nr:response regulator [Alphaproteobacteria bacterium]
MATERKSPLSASVTPPVQTGWTVFVVDDDFDDQILNKRILEKSPYIKDVICLGSAWELFSELQARHFFYDAPNNPPNSMIMLDIHMPGTDGISLLEQLKSSPYTENIPVMIVSGDGRTKNVQDVHGLNACGFLTKPLYMENLNNIHAVIEKGKDWRVRGIV